MRIMYFFATVLFTIPLFAQEQEAAFILKESINYHDPEGQLMKGIVSLNLTETRPNGSDRQTSIRFSIPNETFEMTRNIEGVPIKSQVKGGDVSIWVDGKSTYSAEIAKQYKLNKDRVKTMRNYYQYLWLLPMKLEDTGTKLHLKSKMSEFFGQSLYEVKVSYDPSVGKDIWYFYFDPQTYALSGYRFYHDEDINDGEYILLDGEVQSGSVRLPANRKWYTHKEDKFLGEDKLTSLSIK